MDLGGRSPDRNQGITSEARLTHGKVVENRPDLYNMLMGRGTRKEVWQARLLTAYIYVLSLAYYWPEKRYILIPLAMLGAWIPVRHVALHDGFDEIVMDWMKRGLKASLRYTGTLMRSYNTRLQEALSRMGAQTLRKLHNGTQISWTGKKLGRYLISCTGKATISAFDAFTVYTDHLTGHLKIEASEDGVTIVLDGERSKLAQARCHQLWLERLRRRFSTTNEKRATSIWGDRMKILEKVTQGKKMSPSETLMVLSDHAIVMGCQISVGNYNIRPHDDADDLIRLMNSFDVGAYFFDEASDVDESEHHFQDIYDCDRT